MYLVVGFLMTYVYFTLLSRFRLNLKGDIKPASAVTSNRESDPLLAAGEGNYAQNSHFNPYNKTSASAMHSNQFTDSQFSASKSRR